MRKRIVAIALVIALTLSCIDSVYAHSSAGEHWQDLRFVLFGDKHYRGKTRELDGYRIILERASSLCIDQFGGSSSSYLEQLRLKGVKNLPTTIAEFDLDATAQNHRIFTHLGWTTARTDNVTGKTWPRLQSSIYPGDERNCDWPRIWAERQEILRTSVEHVFDFENDRQREAFCGLLYYVHILGDHIEFKHGTYEKGQGQVILISGGHGQPTFITELLDVLAILFEDQRFSYHYMLMVRELQTEEILLNSLLNQNYLPSLYMDQVNAADTDEMDDAQVLALLNEPEKMNTPELFKASYTAHAKRILEILSRHVPYLLKEEKFFREVFY